MTRASKMYKDGPTVKKDEETGRPKVGKREEESDRVQEGMEGVKMEEKSGPHEHARRAMHHRHMHEHMQLHHMHEIEHSMHKGGDKSELHTKHEKEYAAMHTRHHAEMKEMHAHHEKEGGMHGKESGEKIIEKSKEKAE